MAHTPAMAQYYEMKKQNADAILFFRMGDFYEMFDDDALIANTVLGIAVTTRNKNAEKPIPLAWIPFHAREKYLPLLVEAGYKVAIAEQVSDPKLKGIVKREVVRVVTPATIWLEWEGYESQNSMIISLTEEHWKYGISLLDMSESTWKTCEFSSFTSLAQEFYKINPKEVILDKKFYNNEEMKSVLTKKYFLNIFFYEAKKNAYKKLTHHFGTKNLEWFGLEGKNSAIKASALLLSYIEENQQTDFSFLQKISYIHFSKYLKLDESTIRNLDIIYNIATGSAKTATLFWVLQKTKTSMGTNKLRESLLQPLRDRKEIQKRQDFIEAFLADKILLDKVRYELKSVANIHTILNRIALNRTSPRDLIQLKKSLISIQNIFQLIKSDGAKKLQNILF